MDQEAFNADSDARGLSHELRCDDCGSAIEPRHSIAIVCTSVPPSLKGGAQLSRQGGTDYGRTMAMR
eukprot:scaffold337080_cov47-Attheya_sp.AAC.1